jgi:hypothetical protein
MATLVGMALGGWMTSALFDLIGSYRAAILSGFAGTCFTFRWYFGFCSAALGEWQWREWRRPWSRRAALRGMICSEVAAVRLRTADVDRITGHRQPTEPALPGSPENRYSSPQVPGSPGEFRGSA